MPIVPHRQSQMGGKLQLSVAFPDIPPLIIEEPPRSSPSKQLIRLDQNSTSPISLNCLFLAYGKEKYRRSKNRDKQEGEEKYGGAGMGRIDRWGRAKSGGEGWSGKGWEEAGGLE